MERNTVDQYGQSVALLRDNVEKVFVAAENTARAFS
jgi:hypothetical protein